MGILVSMFVSGKSAHLPVQPARVMSCSDFTHYSPLRLLPFCSRPHLHRVFGTHSDFPIPSHVNSKNSSVGESFVFTEFRAPFFFFLMMKLTIYPSLYSLAAFETLCFVSFHFRLSLIWSPRTRCQCRIFLNPSLNHHSASTCLHLSSLFLGFKHTHVSSH